MMKQWVAIIFFISFFFNSKTNKKNKQKKKQPRELLFYMLNKGNNKITEHQSNP